MLQNNRCRLCKWCWDPNSQLQILGLWLFIVWTHTQLSLFSVQPCNTPFLGEKPRLPSRPQATTGSNTAMMSVKRCCKAACKKSPQNLRAWKADWRAHLGQECYIILIIIYHLNDFCLIFQSAAVSLRRTLKASAAFWGSNPLLEFSGSPSLRAKKAERQIMGVVRDNKSVRRPGGFITILYTSYVYIYIY